MLENIMRNLARGTFGNRSEVNTITLETLTEGERLAFYSNPEVREELAWLPADALAEAIQDASIGYTAFSYRN